MIEAGPQRKLMYHFNNENPTHKEHFFPSDKKPHRSFFCKKCQSQVIICISCDRGQIYCKKCSKIANSNRIKKARKNYKNSEKGRLNKQQENRRYYKRLKNRQKEDFQGDQGSPSEAKGISNSLPEILPAEGEKNEPLEVNRSTNDTQKDKKMAPESAKNLEIRFFCAFCCQECSPYTRPNRPWREVRGLWLKRNRYSKGGHHR